MAGRPVLLCALCRRKANPSVMMPKSNAYAPISQTSESAPVPGYTTRTMPKSTESNPEKISIYSLSMTLRSCTAIAIFNTPVMIDHAAIKYSKRNAVIPGQTHQTF